MATLQELREQQKVLAAQIKAAEAEELAKAQKVVEDKIDNLSDEQKQFILDNIKHVGRCSDDYPDNGYSYSQGTGRCPKCMLIEIFQGQHGGEFDFELDVHISRVKV